MKNLITIVLASMLLTACGDLPSVDKPINDLVQEDIDLIIREENNNRFSLGQQALTRGLSCSVVKVNSGTCLYGNSTAAGCTNAMVLNTTGQTTNNFRYYGTFSQETATSASVPNPILPSSLGLIYASEKYRIICTGVLVVRESDYYDFTVKSADAAVLQVNNVTVVNHDNAHPMTQKIGTIFLNRGVRQFKIEYAQTGGNFGLSIKAGGEPIESRFFYQ
jgi:hypothetical protein